MRAAPVFNGRSFSVSLIVPSGNKPMAPSAASSASQAAKVLTLPSVAPSWRRYTGSTPAKLRIGPSGLNFQSVDLARKRTGRGDAATINTGSTNPLAWLAQMSTGRSSEMRSVPSVSMERNQALAISRPNVRTTRSPVLRRFDALVAIAAGA